MDNKEVVLFLPYITTVSYTHLRAHETDSYLVCRLLLEKKKVPPSLSCPASRLITQLGPFDSIRYHSNSDLTLSLFWRSVMSF